MSDFSMLDKDHPERFDPAEQQRGLSPEQRFDALIKAREAEAEYDPRTLGKAKIEKQDALDLLNEWTGNDFCYHHSMSDLYRSEYKAKADAALKKILQLMGVES